MYTNGKFKYGLYLNKNIDSIEGNLFLAVVLPLWESSDQWDTGNIDEHLIFPKASLRIETSTTFHRQNYEKVI